MNRLRVILCWIVMFASSAGWISTGANSAGAMETVSAEDAATSQPLKPLGRRERRDKVRTRARQAAAAALSAEDASASEGAGPRFQMLSAGKRVVILDTITGKTRIIEPEPSALQQRVEIGKSWVTVTVLVNRPERRGKRAESIDR